MQKGQYLQAILRSPKTVFTAKDIALLWGEQLSQVTRVRLSYYVRQGDLYRIRRGLYAKEKNYNKPELATRIFTPSYVSFETILSKEGLTFQYYSQIFVASYLTRELAIDGQVYSFRKIKSPILTDPAGVEHRDESSFASRERAFLDTLYVNADYHFDNLGGLDWTKVFEVLPIYDNKRMTKRTKELYHAATATDQTK
jgi:predicted transcriptional regulator of viral defense system